MDSSEYREWLALADLDSKDDAQRALEESAKKKAAKLKEQRPWQQ